MKNLSKLLGGRKPTIAIDFDGTICEIAPFPEIGNPKEGVKEALIDLKFAGWKIIIFTCRTHKHQRDMCEWLDSYGIPYDEVNYNLDCPEAYQKPMADVYLDDRGLQFKNNWHEIPNLAVKFLVKCPHHVYIPTNPK